MSKTIRIAEARRGCLRWKRLKCTSTYPWQRYRLEGIITTVDFFGLPETVVSSTKNNESRDNYRFHPPFIFVLFFISCVLMNWAVVGGGRFLCVGVVISGFERDSKRRNAEACTDDGEKEQ